MKISIYSIGTRYFITLVLFMSASHINATGLDIFDDPDIQASLANQEAKPITFCNRQPTPDEILAILQTIQASEILKNDLYNFTNPLNKRNILDFPEFIPVLCSYPAKHDWIVGGHLFFNLMNRSNFTKKSTDLCCSYLNLQCPTLIEAIENALNQAGDLIDGAEFNFDVRKILNLFACTTVQQRRLGVMLHAMRQWERVRVRFHVPLYYQERNFFLTEEEQVAIEAEFGRLGPREQAKFQKDHLISDRLGFGDTRLEVDYSIVDQDYFKFRAGLLSTIPTAVPIASGIMGSTFPKSFMLPRANILQQIFDIALAQQPIMLDQKDVNRILDIIQPFLLGALDRLSANLLDDELGNNHHFGIGPLLRWQTCLYRFIKRPWARNIWFCTRASLEYLFPANEMRFFIEESNPEAFDARNFDDDTKSAENLQFLEEELVKRLYPVAFKVYVKPGVIFRYTSRMMYEGERVNFSLGSDFWLRATEEQTRIRRKEPLGKRINTKKAIPPRAWQSKLHANVAIKIPRKDNMWILSLHADATYNSAGIGKDFSVSINLEKNF